jgi:hypothetical protein
MAYILQNVLRKATYWKTAMQRQQRAFVQFVKLEEKNKAQ